MPPEDESNNGVSVEAVTSTNVGSVTSEVSTTAAPEARNETIIDWGKAIPAEYQEKPYIKELLKNKEPGKELFKQFDGLQSKLGQSITVPGDDAPEEDWSKFYEKTRPKSHDEYNFGPLELGDDKKELADAFNNELAAEKQAEIKKIMHEEGLTKRQAERVYKRVQEFRAKEFGDLHVEYATHQARLDNEFKSLAEKAWGPKWKEKEQELGPLVRESVPKELHQYMADLPAPALLALATQAQYYKNKYEKEDGYSPRGAASGATTAAELRAELRDSLNESLKAGAMDPKSKERAAYRRELTARIERLERGER